MRAAVKSWLPLAILATLMSGLMYLTVRQNYRQTANDPQIQMAEDAAVALSNGQLPPAVVPASKIELSQSLAPYLIVFDQSGHVVASSAELEGEAPVVPAGVFDYVKQHGQDRFTWQPRPDVRSAVVMTRSSGNPAYFVLAGRSLREVEQRESQLTIEVGLAWVVILGMTLGAIIISRKTLP